MFQRNRIVPVDLSLNEASQSIFYQQNTIELGIINNPGINFQQEGRSSHNNSQLQGQQTHNNTHLNNNIITKNETDCNVMRYSKLYEHRFNICCFGNVICYSKRYFSPISCFFLILIPVLITFFYPIKGIIEDKRIGTLISYIVVIFLCYLNYFSLLLTNPGVIPRRIKDKADEIQIPEKIFPDNYILINTGGSIEVIKYCETCNIYRSPRSAHCPMCDCCIELIDHHCPWINICIGKRNYRSFYFFIFWMNVGIIYSFVLNAILLFDSQNISQSIGKNIPSLIALIYLIIAFFFTSNLFYFHTLLVITSQTTREYIKLGHRVSFYYRMFNTQPLINFRENVQIGQNRNQIDFSQSQMANLIYHRDQSQINQQEDSVLSQSKLDKYNDQNSIKTQNNQNNIQDNNELSKVLINSKNDSIMNHHINSYIIKKRESREINLPSSSTNNKENTFSIMNKSLSDYKSVKNIQDNELYFSRSVQATSPDNFRKKKDGDIHQRKLSTSEQKYHFDKTQKNNFVKDDNTRFDVSNTNCSQRNQKNFMSLICLDDLQDIQDSSKNNRSQNFKTINQCAEDAEDQDTPKGNTTCI